MRVIWNWKEDWTASGITWAGSIQKDYKINLSPFSPKIAENIANRTIENEVVVLNLKNGLYYVLNETAIRMWEWLFVNKKSLSKIVSNIASEYQVEDKDMIKKDVDEQLDYWIKENLIVKA